MKKILIILFLISNICFAQQSWNLVSFNGYIEGVSFCNPTIGWTVGSGGLIFKTTNGGNNWILKSPQNPANNYDKVISITPEICIVANTYNGSLMKTSDGGTNWFNINNFGAMDIWSLSYINANNIWLLADSCIYKSTDLGNNWNVVSIQSSQLRNMKFVDENTGFMKNIYNHYFLKTTNGGINWFVLPLQLNFSTYDFINSNTGFVQVSNQLLKTTNGGNNWETIFTLQTSTSYWTDLHFINNRIGYGIDINGFVYKTINGGYNWVPICGDNNYSYERWIYCYDSLNLYYGTINLRLLRTTNGGNTFSTVISSNYPDFQNIYNCQFFNNATGYFFSNDKIIKTTNTGDNFTSINNNNEIPFFCNENTGYKIYTNSVFKTTNGGNNWNLSIIFSNSIYLNNLFFLDENNGWVVGSNYDNITYSQDLFLAKTTNGGNNWEYHIGYNGLTIGSIQSAHFVDNNTGWCRVSDYNISYDYIIKTTNGGNNFVRILENLQYDYGNELLINSNTGYVVSGRKIYKTTNAGNNWTQTIFPNSVFLDVCFVNAYTGWVCGDYGDVYKTTNEGINWFKINTGLNYSFKNIEFINSNTGFITGDGGLILKTTDGGSVFVNQTVVESPSSFKLFQNFPNPFNPTTTIKFEISKSSNVKISVFDITGKEIETLVNEKLNAGTYQTEWNGTSYSSGIYFYKMITDGYVETKRMILLR